MTSHSRDKMTDFGYQRVFREQKSTLVGEIFSRVASKYDLMNDAMSLGVHRFWKQYLIDEAQVKCNDIILDVASGTGDLAKAFARKLGKSGQLFATDINQAMLEKGRDHLIDAGLLGNTYFVLADAESLPFANDHFDLVTISFGLRNITHKEAALASMYKSLKPGGKLLILEFSHPSSAFVKKMYDLYSFQVIPWLGEVLASDRDSYQYLVESIRMHPKQETLKKMMEAVGFEDVSYTNLSGGIVALHKGYKY